MSAAAWLVQVGPMATRQAANSAKSSMPSVAPASSSVWFGDGQRGNCASTLLSPVHLDLAPDSESVSLPPVLVSLSLLSAATASLQSVPLALPPSALLWHLAIPLIAVSTCLPKFLAIVERHFASALLWACAGTADATIANAATNAAAWASERSFIVVTPPCCENESDAGNRILGFRIFNRSALKGPCTRRTIPRRGENYCSSHTLSRKEGQDFGGGAGLNGHSGNAAMRRDLL